MHPWFIRFADFLLQNLPDAIAYERSGFLSSCGLRFSSDSIVYQSMWKLPRFLSSGSGETQGNLYRSAGQDLDKFLSSWDLKYGIFAFYSADILQ
jgi:hypothetical protein